MPGARRTRDLVRSVERTRVRNHSYAASTGIPCARESIGVKNLDKSMRYGCGVHVCVVIRWGQNLPGIAVQNSAMHERRTWPTAARPYAQSINAGVTMPPCGNKNSQPLVDVIGPHRRLSVAWARPCLTSPHAVTRSRASHAGAFNRPRCACSTRLSQVRHILKNGLLPQSYAFSGKIMQI
jgi:hypothetical protein